VLQRASLVSSWQNEEVELGKEEEEGRKQIF
jgi:hypothetical protein